MTPTSREDIDRMVIDRTLTDETLKELAEARLAAMAHGHYDLYRSWVALLVYAHERWSDLSYSPACDDRVMRSLLVDSPDDAMEALAIEAVEMDEQEAYEQSEQYRDELRAEFAGERMYEESL